MRFAIPHVHRPLALPLPLVAVALALCYPWFLAAFFDEVHGHHPWGALLAMTLIFAVPASAFWSLVRLARIDAGDGKVVILRRLTHLAFASPPLFVILGVFLYLMKINGADGHVWLGLWAAVIIGCLLALSASRGGAALAPSPPNTTLVRVLHGGVSVVLIGVFLLPHLGNHALGLLGTDVHASVMKMLRRVYRAGAIEPLLIGLFFFQIVSGLVLLVPKLGVKQDLLDSLQTASGTYLVVFIASHINSVFVLARYFGTDTNYAWATAAPGGLMGDPWNVRLIPHYALGVLLVLCHISCGLRTVMLAHDIPRPRANRIAGALIAGSAIWTAVVVAGMLGVRV